MSISDNIGVDDAPGRRPGLGALALATVLALAVLAPGARAPFSRDDLLAVVEIQDIAIRGHWLVNHDQYPELFNVMARDQFGPINRKPPLFYWLSAIAVDIAGGQVDTVTTRIVPIAAAVVVALITLTWSSIWIGSAAGWIAFLFVLGSYAFAARATIVLVDMTMTALLFGAWCLIYPILERREVSTARVLKIGALLGLAVLTKGPVTIVLCAIGAIIYLASVRRNPIVLLGRGWPWIVLAIAGAIAAAWFVPALMVVGRDLGRVMIDENVGHLMPASMGGIGEAERPPWFIAGHLIGGMVPLSLMIPAAILALSGYGFDHRSLHPTRFQAAMVIAVLVLFSLGTSKRSDYILPAVPPLAIIYAALFTSLDGSIALSRLTIRLRNAAVAIISVGALALIGGVLIAAHRVELSKPIAAAFNNYEQVYIRWYIEQASGPHLIFSTLLVLCAGGAVGALVGLYHDKSQVSGFGVAIVALALITLWTAEVTPMRLDSESLAPFALEVGRITDGADLYLMRGYYDREIAFDLGRFIPYVDKRTRADLATGRPVYVVTMPADAARLAAALNANLTEVAQANPVVGHQPPALFRLEPAAR